MFRERITELMNKMTLTEKIGQMHQVGTSIYTSDLQVNEDIVKKIREGKIGSFLSVCGVEKINELQRIAVEESRLGIPLFFGHDIIHGYRTIFPVPAGEACSFEPELAYESSKVAAMETRANGIQVVWAPMIDIARDQRWGRGFEGSGEDVLLSKEFARARVQGFQNAPLETENAVASCAKHYVGYGAVEGGRDYNDVDMSDNNLYNIHLEPFREAISAGAEFVMTAYNTLNGIPCTGNKKIIREILRKELNFKGIVISDAASLENMMAHGYADGEKEAVRLALEAGLDIEMMTDLNIRNLEEVVAGNDEYQKLVDEAVYRILELKFRLGLFEHPYTNVSKASETVELPESMNLARKIAQRSMVLLENKGVLPIKGKKVAVIGRLADTPRAMIGGWVSAERDRTVETAVTIKAAMNECKDLKRTYYAPGYHFVDLGNELTEMIKRKEFELFSTTEALIEEAVETAKKAEVILFVAGETTIMSGEAKNRASLSIPAVQVKLLEKLYDLGKPIITLVISGRPLVLNEVKKYSDALLFTYSLGTQMGNAVWDVITGRYNPSAKLVNTFPSGEGQCPTMYYSHNNGGKPYDENIWYSSKYIDVPYKPEYPFGYGKSYTEFTYEQLVIEHSKYKFGDKIHVSAQLNNVGEYDGEEVVQVYVRDMVGSIVRPVRQLVAFRKVEVKKGMSKKVTFELDTDQLGFYMDRRYIKEVGKFQIFVGGSADCELSADFEIV